MTGRARLAMAVEPATAQIQLQMRWLEDRVASKPSAWGTSLRRSKPGLRSARLVQGEHAELNRKASVKASAAKDGYALGRPWMKPPRGFVGDCRITRINGLIRTRKTSCPTKPSSRRTGETHRSRGTKSPRERVRL
jgi:hypothetical protein